MVLDYRFDLVDKTMELVLLVLCAIACNCELSHFELALPGEDKKDVGCVQHREDEVEDEADKEELSHLVWSFIFKN